MRFHLFQYTLPADPDLEDLNTFLASHPVATVSQHVVTTTGGPLLVFVVETVGSASSAKRSMTSAPKVDYREVLTDDQFAIFSRLREERKRVADADGVPVYAVFSNAQLAEMVTSQFTTTEELSKIDGIGKARVEKYATYFLPILSTAFTTKPEAET